jgi:hypothetical protein
MMKKQWVTAAIVTVGLMGSFLGSTAAHAAKFANQFVEFELPAQWQCNLEGAEWVCQSLNEQKKRDAIIVLAAKLKGDQDSLDLYQTYLKGAKVYTSVQGRSVKSDPKYAKKVSINGQDWIDSLHLESEIPGFYTRYLATVKADIGVLVTYSINKDKYQQYLPEFENMVKTLRVFRKTGGLNTNPQAGNLFANSNPGANDNTIFPGAIPEGGNDAPKQKKDNGLPIEALAAGAAVVAFLMWKRKQRRG